MRKPLKMSLCTYFLAFAITFVFVDGHPARTSSPQNNVDPYNMTTAEFSRISRTLECGNKKPWYNPYRQELHRMFKTHEDGVDAWHDYFSRLPEQCQPNPYNLAIADGRTTDEAEEAKAEYVKVNELVRKQPMIVDSYYQGIERGGTPAQAYLHWIKYRKGWSVYEWQP